MKQNRIWELDFIRGFAIVFMVTFHFIVDVDTFLPYKIEYLKGFWYYVGTISALLFIFIAGVSSTLSRNNLKRGAKVLLMGMVVTAATYIFDSSTYIRFGILHFLGCSMIIYYFIRNSSILLEILMAAAAIPIGLILRSKTVEFAFLLPFGLTYSSFVSLDYYPLLPWISVYFLGNAAGKLFYKQRKSLFPWSVNNKALSFMGQHSLFIYMAHQPILIGTLLLLLKLNK